ncbi:hypothetical protein SRABI106_03314 [Rahnella aquatilis]|nr:hypothetical protein SRABI106_03314 [Rahnella aquatilis]
MRFAIALVADNAAGSCCTQVQGIQRDLVSISKTGFFTAYRTNTDALIDIVRTVFDDAVFDHPAFMETGLEKEIGIIKTTFRQLAQNGKQILMTQIISS